MTTKKSHLRRKPRHEKPVPLGKRDYKLIPGEDRVLIRPDPGDETQNYTMPRGEALKLVKQGKIKSSNRGGFEATDKYPKG